MARTASARWNLRTRRSRDSSLTVAAIAGASACTALAVALASGSVSSGGPKALAVAGFVLLVVWCVTHRRVDHTLFALVLYLGLFDGYAKLSTGSSVTTVARDALLLAIAAGAFLRNATGGERIALPPLSGFVVAFSGVVLIELANPSTRGLSAGLAGVRQHLEFMPLFFLGYAFVRTESQLRKALMLLVFCAAVGGVVSYVQSRLSPQQLATWGPGYAQRILGTGSFTGGGRVASVNGQTFVRPFGLASDAGGGAAMAALALPGLVALLLLTKGRVRWALLPLSAGVGLAVATSGARAATVTAFVSLLAFGAIAAVSKNALKAVLGIAVGLTILYAVFSQLGGNSATNRAQSVAPAKVFSTFSGERGSSVAAFGGELTSVPLGVGLATAGPAASFQPTVAMHKLYNAETEWNFLLLETSIVGVVVYVAFLLRLIWLAFTRIRRFTAPTIRLLLAALAAPICAELVAGFSGPTTASVPMAPYLWLVSGVLAYWLITAYRANAARSGEFGLGSGDIAPDQARNAQLNGDAARTH